MPPQRKSPGGSKASSRASSAASKNDPANSTMRPIDNLIPSTLLNTHSNDTYFDDGDETATRDLQNFLSQQNNDDEEEIEEDYDREDDESVKPSNDWTNNDVEDTLNNNRESRDTMRSHDDDEDVVSSARASMDEYNKTDKVTVEIESYAFNAQSEILKNETVKELFVSLKFLQLDKDPIDSEPKPKPTKPNQPVHFNFKQEFLVDSKHNYDARTRLARALIENKPAIITFSVVSEPENKEDTEADCYDVAFCDVNIKDILQKKENIVSRNLNIYDFNNPTEIVGYIKISVEILDVLLAIQNEMVTNN